MWGNLTTTNLPILLKTQTKNVFLSFSEEVAVLCVVPVSWPRLYRL